MLISDHGHVGVELALFAARVEHELHQLDQLRESLWPLQIAQFDPQMFHQQFRVPLRRHLQPQSTTFGQSRDG